MMKTITMMIIIIHPLKQSNIKPDGKAKLITLNLMPNKICVCIKYGE